MARDALDVKRLWFDVEWAMSRGLDHDVVPMLEKLIERAEPGSDADLYGRRHLARRIVHREPWRALLLARAVVAARDDAVAWSVLGTAHWLLDNSRSAVRAYRRALQLDPDCAETAHNLGHLLDAGLARPRAALPLLARAHQLEPGVDAIATSYAHALLRAGKRGAARQLLSERQPEGTDVDSILDEWESGGRAAE